MEDAQMFVGTEFRRSVKVEGAQPEHYKLLAVELYEDGLILRVVALKGLEVRAEPGKTDSLVTPAFEIEDGLGTRYTTSDPQRTTVESFPYRADYPFTPAVPKGVTHLTVIDANSRSSWTVDLARTQEPCGQDAGAHDGES